nr:MAG: thymidine kinase [Diabrotica toursvirus 3a]
MYCIEGNISSGKSTIINRLTNTFEAYQEPIHEWTLLRHFYKDKLTYAFPFQYQILISYINLFNSVKESDSAIFIERHPWSCKNIFIDVLKDQNMWDVNDELQYEKLYSVSSESFKIKKMFYLNLSPTQCLERFRKRNREGEILTIDDLVKLENKFKQKLCIQNEFPVKIINVEGKSSCEIEKEILQELN